MKRVVVYPYSMASMSGRNLARSFDRGIRVYPDRTYRPRDNHLVVNWGNSNAPVWDNFISYANFINLPSQVEVATNKREAFRNLRRNDVSIPKFTTDVHEAHEWDSPVVARELLRSHSGRGAHYVPRSNRDVLLGSLSGCPLYVEYIKKSAEYRIHVFQGEVIDEQQKRVRAGSEENDFQIRSYQNGWVFCRDTLRIPDRVRSGAVGAVQALGLDFGAVDVIWNEHYDMSYVLEVNTAPGLHGSTLSTYVDAITRLR